MKNIRWIVIVAMVLVGLWSPMASPEIYPPQPVRTVTVPKDDPLFGAVRIDEPSADVTKDGPVNTASLGRYQIVMSPIARVDTFLLDTVTGRSWQLTQYSDLPGKPMVWQSMDRFDTHKAEADWIEQYKALITKPQPIK